MEILLYYKSAEWREIATFKILKCSAAKDWKYLCATQETKNPEQLTKLWDGRCKLVVQVNFLTVKVVIGWNRLEDYDVRTQTTKNIRTHKGSRHIFWLPKTWGLAKKTRSSVGMSGSPIVHRFITLHSLEYKHNERDSTCRRDECSPPLLVSATKLMEREHGKDITRRSGYTL